MSWRVGGLEPWQRGLSVASKASGSHSVPYSVTVFRTPILLPCRILTFLWFEALGLCHVTPMGGRLRWSTS